MIPAKSPTDADVPAIRAAAEKYGVHPDVPVIRSMTVHGRAWIVAEVAKLKAARTPANSAKVDRILAQARVAWEVAQ